MWIITTTLRGGEERIMGPRNTDLDAPWNDGMRKDDVFEPWNDSMKKDELVKEVEKAQKAIITRMGKLYPGEY